VLAPLLLLLLLLQQFRSICKTWKSPLFSAALAAAATPIDFARPGNLLFSARALPRGEEEDGLGRNTSFTPGGKGWNW
jgi:hypothetical protein